MLELDGVQLRLGQRHFGFDLRVPTGECTALIGPSGAGKSTLLSVVAGFALPDSGRVLIGGRDVTQLGAARRPVSSVFQEHNLFAHLDVAANVGLGLDPGLRLDPRQRAQVSDALAKVGLADCGTRMPGELSGGERQRVALARALVRRRPVLLLDEPFAALGPAMRRDMLELLRALINAEQLTTLLVSHHPDDARQIAGNTAFVFDGHILRHEHSAELLDRGDLPELNDYLGTCAHD